VDDPGGHGVLRKMRVTLLGHGVGIPRVIDALKSIGHEICCLVTHPREEHEKDRDLSEIFNRYGLYASIFEEAKKRKIPLLETQDSNESASIEWIKSHRPDWIVSVSLRNILRSEFLDAFADRVLNLHMAPLPMYRGGAHDTWMILGNEREAYASCHFIDKGLDTGAIVSTYPYTIPLNARPIDVYRSRMEIIGELIISAFHKLQGGEFTPTPQNRTEGFTFPKLRTDIDGQILWTWTAESIERQVRAFGLPYKGAFTFLNGSRIRVVDGFVDSKNKMSFHPLSTGLVIGRSEGEGFRVVTGNGVYVITEASEKLRIGKRFEAVSYNRLEDMLNI
jgi:methionyl-tRNA formyltransferase